jgi:hypothetical protein
VNILFPSRSLSNKHNPGPIWTFTRDGPLTTLMETTSGTNTNLPGNGAQIHEYIILKLNQDLPTSQIY